MIRSPTASAVVRAPTGNLRERLLAYTEIDATSQLSGRMWLLVGLIILLALFPTIFIPLSHDEALFFVSGERILGGAAHYRGIIDLKPPIIYYLYAVGIALFGPTGTGFRVFDLLLQGITCYLIISTVRKATGNDHWGALAAIIYAVTYGGQHGAAQPESYMGLFGIAMLRCQIFRRTGFGFVIIGLLAGALFFLKFTFGILLAGALLGELLVFRQPPRAVLLNAIRMAVGFALVAGLFVLYLFANGAYHDFLLMNQFVRGYSAIQWSHPGALIKEMIKTVPGIFADRYSLAMTAATAVGVAASIPSRSDAATGTPTNRQALLRLVTIGFVLLCLSLVVEGKFFAYQFGRLFPFGAILSAYGILRLLGLYFTIRRRDRYALFLALTLVLVAIVVSPLTRLVRHTVGTAIYLHSGFDAYDTFYDLQSEGYTYHEVLQVTGYIRGHGTPDDRLFALTPFGGIFHLYAGKVPDFRIYHSAFLLAPFAPQEWRDSTTSYLRATVPKFIVVTTHDLSSDTNGSDRTSLQCLLDLPGIDSLLSGRYRVAMDTPHVRLYERTDGAAPQNAPTQIGG